MSTKEPILLSVDFDYFVREDPMWDWGHSESPLFKDFIWAIRAQGALASGFNIFEETDPYRHGVPSPDVFWDNLIQRGMGFSSTSSFIVADSRLWASTYFSSLLKERGIERARLFNFDAHHDLGYSNGRDYSKSVDCSNWLGFLLDRFPRLTTQLVFPGWKGEEPWEGAVGDCIQPRISSCVWGGSSDHMDARGEVIGIYFCRSGAWTPPWTDGIYTGMVRDLEKILGLKSEARFCTDESDLSPLEVRRFEQP